MTMSDEEALRAVSFPNGGENIFQATLKRIPSADGYVVTAGGMRFPKFPGVFESLEEANTVFEAQIAPFQKHERYLKMSVREQHIYRLTVVLKGCLSNADNEVYVRPDGSMAITSAMLKACTENDELYISEMIEVVNQLAILSKSREKIKQPFQPDWSQYHGRLR